LILLLLPPPGLLLIERLQTPPTTKDTRYNRSEDSRRRGYNPPTFLTITVSIIDGGHIEDL
jgi:hypothetical protein